MPPRHAGLLIALAAALLAAASARPQAASANDSSRLALVESLVDHRTFAIDDSVFVRPPPEESGRNPFLHGHPELPFEGTSDKVFVDGHFYSDKPPVLSLLLAGPYAALRATTGLRVADRPGWFCYLMTLLGCGPAYVVAVWGVWRLALGLGLMWRLALGVTASFGLATVAPAYLSYLNGHMPLLGCAVPVLLLLDRLRREPDRVGPWALLGAGSLAGLAYALEQPTGGLLLAGAAGVVFLRRPGVRAAGLFVLGALPWVALHQGLTYAVAGSFRPINADPKHFGYEGSHFDRSNMTGFWNHGTGLVGVGNFVWYAFTLLFGGRGFIHCNLPLYLTLPAAALLLTRPGPHRLDALFALFWAGGTWLVYAALSNNYAGSSCSVRWFVPLLAPAYLLLALLVRDWPGFRTDFAVLSVCGAALGASMWWEGTWAYDVPLLLEAPAAALCGWIALTPHLPRRPEKVPAAFWAWLGFAALAAVTLLPLYLEPRPVAFIADLSPERRGNGRALVLAVFAVVVGLRARLDRSDGPGGPWRTLSFAAAAGLFALIHYLGVDRQNEEWQRDWYLGVLNGTYGAPHQFRPLPCGFVRLLERLSGSWLWSCVAYRWFFSFWFLWASYRLARLALPPRLALAALLPVVLLYPLSIARYRGQLTDPLSHSLLVLSLVYAVEGLALRLAAALFLGVLAKETAVLVVPAYLIVRLGDWRAWLKAAALGGVALAAFLLARPGWRPGVGAEMNEAGLMIGTNLGIGEPIADSGGVPVWEGYLHLLLFTVPFLVPLLWGWRRCDRRLLLAALAFGPPLLFSSVAWGWLFESRNHLPLVPLLATLAVQSQVCNSSRRPP
jgi:hypothetical protein